MAVFFAYTSDAAGEFLTRAARYSGTAPASPAAGSPYLRNLRCRRGIYKYQKLDGGKTISLATVKVTFADAATYAALVEKAVGLPTVTGQAVLTTGLTGGTWVLVSKEDERIAKSVLRGQ